jgi:hypothetical protein
LSDATKRGHNKGQPVQLGPDQEGGNATLVLVVGGHGLVAAPDAENEIRFRNVGNPFSR